MKKLLGVALCGLLLAGTTWAYQNAVGRRSGFGDEVHGYALDLPLFPGDGPGQSSIPAIFHGPPVKGFATNVAVHVQASATTRDQYRAKTLAELRQLGVRINADQDVTVSGREALRLDYDGSVEGKNLHFLALTVIDKDRVIVVACTAAAESFAAVEPEFRACLDSFRLK